MNTFLILATLLILLSAAILLLPLLRQPRAETSPNSEAANTLTILREQRQALTREHQQGQISAEAYQQGLDELTQRAIQEEAGNEAHAAAAPRRAKNWAIGLGLLFPLAAALLYIQLGNLEGTLPTAPVIGQGQLNAQIQTLEAHVKQHPEDNKASQQLARTWLVTGRYPEAIAIFERLAQQSPSAEIYTDWADALSNLPSSTPAQIGKLLEQALKLDPNHVKTLALIGSLAFDQKDYPRAITVWQNIAQRIPPEEANSDFAQTLGKMIAEAQRRSGALASQPSPLNIQGRITLAQSLAAEVGPQDTLFIFARPAAGGPPVAALRVRAADLPFDFDFRQATIMQTPGEGPWQLGARISKNGQALPQTGDLEGFAAKVKNGSKNVQIEINQRHK